VVPVVDARADDDRATAIARLCGLCPLPREVDHRRRSDPGVALLPCGREGKVVVFVAGRPFAFKASVHAILRELQVVNRRNLHRAIDGIDLAHGHVALVDFVAEPLGEVVEHRDANGCVRSVFQGEQRDKRLAGARVFLLDVPLALFFLPAVAHLAGRHAEFTGLVQHEHLPFGVLFGLVSANCEARKRFPGR
jgi:hypothetical protein